MRHTRVIGRSRPLRAELDLSFDSKEDWTPVLNWYDYVLRFFIVIAEFAAIKR